MVRRTNSIIMKDLVLSLLSRGYSQVVQEDDGGPYGRLEVYFEPEDYFNWKSQPPLLRLTSSGRLLGGVDPAPPKTFSTRRGPLLLYSEDLALSSCQPHKVTRKRRAFRASREEAEVQLHTLQDLTEAILAYGKKQAKVTCHTSAQPPLSASKRTTQRLYPYHWPAEEEHYVTQSAGEGREECGSSTGQGNSVYPRSGQVRYQPRFLCLPRPHRPLPGSLPSIAQSLAPVRSEDRPHLAPGDPVTPKTKGPEDLAVNRDVKTSFRTAMGTPRVRMSPIPEAETSPQEKLTGWPEDQTVTEHLTGYPKDISGQWKQSAIETGGEESGHSLRPAYMDSSLGCSHLSRVNNYRRHMEGACQQGPVKQNATDIHVKKTNVPPNPGLNFCHLPLINQASPSDSDSKDQRVKAGSNTRENHKDSVPRLPDIHLTNTNTETPGPKPPERTILRKVLVLLPSQKEKDGLHGLSEDEEEREDGLPKKETREDVLCGGVEQKGGVIVRGGENEPVEHGCQLKATEQYQLIWFEPEEDKEHQTAPGLLPQLVGRRGPGKQSSMALYRQDPHDLADQSEPQPGIIRGSLPLVLRECEKGRALGTLIMGPAGEIIRLSFWDALTDTEDHPVLDDATREHVLRVMTSEGVLEQPWTILLEEQTTHPDRMNSSELEAEPDYKEEASSNQEDRPAAAEHTEAVKNVERGADGKRMGEGQDCAPEQRSGKLNPSIENQPYTKGEDVEIKRRGRTQGLQPEGGATPGSPKLKATSASSPQKTTLSTPTAAEDRIPKAKPGSQTNTNKDNIRSQFKKAGGGDDAESTQIRKVKKEGEVDQHVRGVRENKHPQKKTVQTNTESEDAVYTADTTPGPILKKNKTAEESKKPNASTSQPKESAKPQNNVNKVKRKTKGRAAFVVGKPRQIQEAQQIAKEADQPEMSERTAFKTEEKEPENEALHDHCCSAPGHSLDTVSVYQEDHTAAVSPRIHSSATVSSRTHSSTEFSFRMHSSDAASSRAHSSAGFSFRMHGPDELSSRAHSSTAVPTAREGYRRTSKAAEAKACSPASLSLTQLPSHSAAPTHHPTSNPTKSESGVDAKCNEEAISLIDSKAAAQAEKAERRRLEVERKRKEREEEWRRQQEREEREEREEKMRLELEEEQRQRVEQARLRKLAEEEERQRQEQKEMERQKREKTEMERERRRQEEKRRLLERFQRERQEEEERRAAELKRRQQEEEAQRELERKKLQEMGESERLEYLRRKQEEEEMRRKAAEERRRAEEEAAMQVEEEARLLAQLTAKQRAALEHQLRFHRSLFVEAGGLEKTQDISRPWVFSYFNLLKLLGLAEPPEELVKDVL